MLLFRTTFIETKINESIFHCSYFSMNNERSGFFSINPLFTRAFDVAFEMLAQWIEFATRFYCMHLLNRQIDKWTKLHTRQQLNSQSNNNHMELMMGTFLWSDADFNNYIHVWLSTHIRIFTMKYSKLMKKTTQLAPWQSNWCFE